jgi:hypothetical protein
VHSYMQTLKGDELGDARAMSERDVRGSYPRGMQAHQRV